MAYNEAGFLRPHVDAQLDSDDDLLIGGVCPGGRIEQEKKRNGHDPVWGTILELYTGHATDSELRFRASSGGALSAIVRYLIESGLADYALHVGASGTVPWLNEVAKSTDRSGVLERAGSRYAPSSPLADIVPRLQQPGRFVFVGKPCDVAALRMYARRDRRVDEKVVAMISFMCGGIPSERGILELMKRMNVDPSSVETFRFRGHGWPGRTTAVLKTGEVRTLSYDEAWGDVLSWHLQKRCKICPDGTGVTADIVCADAWFLDEQGFPSFGEREGRSLVMVRTPRGSALLKNAVEKQMIALEPFAVANLRKIQPYQEERTRLTLSRLCAMALLGQRIPSFPGFSLARAALGAGVTANLRSFLGAIRRVLLGRL